MKLNLLLNLFKDDKQSIAEIKELFRLIISEYMQFLKIRISLEFVLLLKENQIQK